MAGGRGCSWGRALALVMLVAVVPGAAAEEKDEAAGLIREVLPAWRQDAEACFQGSFSSETIEVEDWRKTTAVAVPGLIRDGKPVMRPQPEILRDQAVRTVTLQLTYDNRHAVDYDRAFGFGLSIEIGGWQETLFAAGDCPYRDTPRMHDGYDVPATTTTLYCGIDCDGGGMAIERLPASREVAVVFDGWPGGMRMSASCTEGLFRVGGTSASDGSPVPRAARKVTRLRLHKAPRSACSPIARWWAVERERR